MNRTANLAATALSAAVLLTGTLASQAHAETRTITDRAGDGSNGTGPGGPHKYGDIGKVRVKHAPRMLEVAVLPTRRGQLADYYVLYVDTRPADPGPEFAVGTSAETETYTVARVERFGGWGPATCEGDATWRFGRQSLVVAVPRICLREGAGLAPDRMRVAVRSAMDYEEADWAPRVRTFGPWVRRAAA